MVTIPRTADVPDFPTLEPGWYKLKIAAVKEPKPDKNGDMFVAIEFNVDGQPNKVWDVFYLQKEERLPKLKNFLKKIDENLCDVAFDGEKELLEKEIYAHIIAPHQAEGLPRIREYASIDQVNPEDLKTAEDEEGLPF